eukprot:2010759-Alexandrium_andersonii.AAC.1
MRRRDRRRRRNRAPIQLHGRQGREGTGVADGGRRPAGGHASQRTLKRRPRSGFRGHAHHPPLGGPQT